MESYAPLLERTRLPQPSLQRFAVSQIFDKLQSGPAHLGPDSDAGRESITLCLHSSSPAVVDQSVRELCKLVKRSNLDLSRGLLELQSALEGADPRFVDVFVKGIGFLARLGFREKRNCGVGWDFETTERHPFVKVLSCRTEVQSELVRQVALFVVQNKDHGMLEVCTFLKPLLDFSVLRIPFSDSSSTSFTRLLISSLASLCCSFPSEAVPIFNMLICTLRYFECSGDEDFKNILGLLESLVDAHVFVLRNLVRMDLAVQGAQLSVVKLLEAALSLCSNFEKTFSSEPIIELSRRLLTVQKELDLPYLPELLSPVLSLYVILSGLELEHEQLSILNLLMLLIRWATDNGAGIARDMPEMLLFFFPLINLVSSTSKSVKGAAADLLLTLEKLPVQVLVTNRVDLSIDRGSRSVNNPEMIIFRLFQRLWVQELSSSSFFLDIASPINIDLEVKQTDFGYSSWFSQLRKFALSVAGRQKVPFPSILPDKTILTEMPLLLGSLVGSVLLHQSFASSAVDTLAAFGTMEPRLGFVLLLSIIYYNNFLRLKGLDCHDLPLKLMGMLPSLASNNAMLPFVVQTIMPMLRKDGEPALCATAIRLMCKTWEINDRAFGSLQAVLLPERFSELASERATCISMAASVRDICKHNPDRGVDLILSVSACIESHDPGVQVLGFHSLSHLCEADVVDFYTAWAVISRNVRDHTADPFVASSLCSLLRWGAMDAEAYPDASKHILQMLWEVATYSHSVVDIMWAKARKSALEALNYFELIPAEDAIEDYKHMVFELLVSEPNLDILSTLEQIEGKIIAHEHKNRRRLVVKEKRVSVSKIEKLLDVFPQVISCTVKTSIAQELPGATLLCLPLIPKEVGRQGQSREYDVLAQYDNVMKETATSLHLSRNITLALLSVESWKPFMQRWVKAYIGFLELKAPSAVLDKTSKAASDILKSMIKMTEDSIPRSAENIALALGAFCTVLPPSVHPVKAAALKFLLDWLYQPEHEYRQWSAAISVGLISSSLHVTDHKQKLQNMNALVEVACSCKSILVKGACGVGLGFASQHLLSREAVGGISDEEPSSTEELELLGRIVRTLSSLICQLTKSSSVPLHNLSQYNPPGSEDINMDVLPKFTQENYDEADVDVWGVAGLVLGLGSIVNLLYRAGSYDTLRNVKTLIASWVSRAFSLAQTSEGSDVMSSVGACLALPAVVSFCWKVELMHDDELDNLVVSYRKLIHMLLSNELFTSLHQSLLLASCVGAGNLLACILSEGVHPVEAESVNELLLLFKKAYSSTYPHIIHFGGMLGVVNAMGAGSGTLVNLHHFKASFQKEHEKKESSYVKGSLLSNPSFEPLLTSLMQDIFLVAQNSDDHQLQQYAAWAGSFLWHYLHLREHQTFDDHSKNDMAGHNASSQSFPEDSAVMKLSLWLTKMDHSGTADMSRINTIATVLRCLSRAPRLPALDWLVAVRSCMRYEADFARSHFAVSIPHRASLREECIRFSLAHADKFDPLLSFLDDLSDLSRFRTLDMNLQSCILCNLLDLMRLFSGHRLRKMFSDIAEYFSSPVSSYQSYDRDQKSSLRISCWNGLSNCLNETLLDTSAYISSMENCIQVLFLALPALSDDIPLENEEGSITEEWMQSVKCLGKCRLAWLLDLLKVSEVHLAEHDECFSIAVKKIRIRAQLVRQGFLPLTVLGKLKVCIYNARSQGLWGVLVEVVAALQRAEASVKRQWLLDVLEISCITKHPSTALRFLALLSGSCSKYMPLLVLDPSGVLEDLPITLSSLLSKDSWAAAAELAAPYLWTLTERVHDWATSLTESGPTGPSSLHPIDESENEVSDLLVQVMLQTCVHLKDLLPFEKQLRLASMIPL